MPGGSGKGGKFMRTPCSSNSPSHANANANAIAASSSSSSNSSSIAVFEWQWQTDDLRWRAFDPVLASAIEAARASGRSPIPVSADQGSTPTHLIYILPQTLKQVNLLTRRERPVRRRSVGQSSTVVWEWWDAERNQWNSYDDQLASKFETAWLESISSGTSNKPDSPAGIFFELSGQHYSMLFEADAIQFNLKTSFSRIIRRRTYLLKQPGSIAFTAMGLCHSSHASTVSQGQVTREESEQLKSPESEHSYLIDCPNPKEGENCSVCLSSLQEDEAVELEKCHHIFHRECITQWFKTRPSCPECLTVYGVIKGTQPPGKMSIRYIPITSADAGNGLQGYPDTDIIEITYTFPNGIQTAEHPSPGNQYTGTRRVAYLPKNNEGEEVLELLKIAWNRRLLFMIGTSVTTGRSNTVVWAGIHHKTQKSGGSSAYGYPDETYFNRVKGELANVNVM